MVMAQGFSQEQVAPILSGAAGSGLVGEPSRAVLLLAAKATKSPHQVTGEDITTPGELPFTSPEQAAGPALWAGRRDGPSSRRGGGL